MFWKKQESEQVIFDRYYKTLLHDGKLVPVGMLLQRATQRLPDNIALIQQGKNISYRQLYGAAVRFSKVLQQQGVKANDRVILLMENSPSFYVAYFGIMQLGAIVATVNTFLREREVAHILEDAKPTVIVVSSDLKKIVTDSGPITVPLLTELDMEFKDDEPAQLPEFPVVLLEPDALCCLLYTSGTTGFPKGVMLSSRNILTNVLQALTRFHVGPEDRIFAVLPLFHSFAENACIWIPMVVGCTVIVVPKIERRFILEGLDYKPTLFVGVPALFGLLCLLKTAPLSSIRLFVSGGDVLPDKIRAAFALLYRRNICSGYGLTESSPMVSGDIEDVTVQTNNVGHPILGVQVSFRDEEGREVAPGSVGHICIKGDNIMLGYYNSPDTTAEVIKDGWLLTGDLGYLDEQGRLVISGRLKDLIIHKGFNIYPPEIENVIL
ncbi:MAG TPA: AMP-binding protein, partial [Candidatus Limnocylindria bacterium]|nr:AMP-binding protein [Candidatus Limnocylindria bacterium]